jgi:hypothetical protein
MQDCREQKIKSERIQENCFFIVVPEKVKTKNRLQDRCGEERKRSPAGDDKIF